MKVLIVGGGGREHAIAQAVAKSKKVDKIYCAPGNAGIGMIAECVAIGAMEFDKLVAFAKEKEIDLCVVGMDDPLVGGLVDEMEKAGIRTFGPRKNAAILEGSKAFSKDLMKKYNIPTAAYENFDSSEAALEYLRTKANFPIVLKADGLALGKGVLICNTLEEAKAGVKEIMEEVPKAELEHVAKSIITTLEKEGASNVHIAYGSIVGELKEVSRSYKEAKMALDVGKIFFGEREIMAYSELGIGRLIYQLPIPLCKMFIREIFGNKSPDDFDEETLVTINKFFENSLNVSETSRQLFIHRNTLVYRLDKLQKSTGLDLRVFEDAITFKIAMMVVKYMKYMESFEY